MVSEFVVVWVELNWLRDVAGSVFFVKRDARQTAHTWRAGFSGWLGSVAAWELDGLSALRWIAGMTGWVFM